MSPLEAARTIRMAAVPGRNQNTGQAACCGTPPAASHVPGCAWLAWDRIVAALEATQALVDAHAQFGLWRVVDDPKELGDRQQSALVALWGLGIRPSDPMQSVVEG